MCYGEKYRIVNRKSKLYLDYHGASGQRLPFGNTAKGTLMEFRNHDDKVAAGEIPKDAMVHLHFYYPDKGPEDKGRIFNPYMKGDTRLLNLSSEYGIPLMFRPA